MNSFTTSYKQADVQPCPGAGLYCV